MFIRQQQFAFIFFIQSWVLLLGALTSPFVMAQKPNLQVAFHSTVPCASEDQFHSELHSLLTDVQGKTDARFDVLVSGGESFTVSLKVIAQKKTFVRKVTVRECQLASKVAAVLVAITIDPAALANLSDSAILDTLSQGESTNAPPRDDADDTTETTSPATGSATANSSTPVPSSSDDAATTKDSGNHTEATPANTSSSKNSASLPREIQQEKQRFKPLLSVGFNTTALVLPRWSGGPSVEFSLLRAPLEVFVDGRFSFAPKAIVDTTSDTSFQLWMLSLHSGIGAAFGNRKFLFCPRIGLGAHLLISKTSGLQNDNVYLQWVGSPWVGSMFRFQLFSAGGVFAGANLEWLTANTRYHITEIGVIHETGALLLEANAGFFHFF